MKNTELFNVKLEPQRVSSLPEYDAQIIYLKPDGFEYNQRAFWFIFEWTLGQILARHIRAKSVKLLMEAIASGAYNPEGMDLDDGQAKILSRARRTSDRWMLPELHELRTRFFNHDSPLLQHFVRYVSQSQSLDDVYNATEAFSFNGRPLIPQAGAADLWARFYLSCPNGQAVRNRYRMVARLYADYLGGGNTISVACGSAQPILHARSELKKRGQEAGEKFVLTDLANESLALARLRAEQAGVSEEAEFHQLSFEDIMELVNGSRYDLVEACGILDYLADNQFISLVENSLESLTPQGQIMVSNMMPTRGAQLLRDIYNWEIIYRPATRIAELVHFAGGRDIKVYVEPWGIHSVVTATRRRNKDN